MGVELRRDFLSLPFFCMRDPAQSETGRKQQHCIIAADREACLPQAASSKGRRAKAPHNRAIAPYHVCAEPNEETDMAGTIILILKIAVILVTLLLSGSMIALARGRHSLHGRLNVLVTGLTLAALLGLEVIARLLNPDLFSTHFERHQAQDALVIHLAFSLPSAVLLPLMLVLGFKHRRTLHVGLGIVFLVLWTGTFITGVFFLPHTEP